MLYTRHRWRGTPLDALPWQMTVATALLLPLAAIAEPHGRLLVPEPIALPLTIGTARLIAGIAIVILDRR